MNCEAAAESNLQLITTMAAQLLVVLVPIILFSVYKLISNRRRHVLKMARLEKGIVSVRSRNKGPKWGRSVYLGVFFCVVCVFFGYAFFDWEDNTAGLVGIVLLALGGMFLTRGILKRACWIKEMALDSGVPFEKVFAAKPRRAGWVTSFAVGVPLLAYAYFVYDKEPFDYTKDNAVVMGLFLCVGGALVLRGLLMWWYLWREERRICRAETGSCSCSSPEAAA